MTDRPVARAVAAAGVLILGGIALTRLPISYTPSVTFPDLIVYVDLPDATDPVEVSRSWIEPIESAIRSLGQVQGMRGEVAADGGWIQARFMPGTDSRTKTARLLSDLGALRAGLPEGGVLTVRPVVSAGGDRAAFIALTGESAGTRSLAVADELRGIAGVREVRVYGGAEEETRIRIRPGIPGGRAMAEEARRAVRRSFASVRLGSWSSGGRSLPVVSGSSAPVEISALTVRSGGVVVPLGGVAEIVSRRAAPERLSRFNGRSNVGLEILRDRSVPLLALDEAVRRKAAEIAESSGGRLSLEVVESEAEPLRRLRLDLVWGFLGASLAGLIAGFVMAGAAGALSLGLAPSLAAAGSANGLWLSGGELNAATIPACVLASAFAAGLAALRVASRAAGGAGPPGFLVACAAIVPVSVSLAGGDLAPLLAEPARAFLAAAAAAAVAVTLPSQPARPRRRSLGMGRGIRALLGDPATILLATGSTLYGLFTLFGPSLDPRPDAPSAGAGRLLVRLSLPEGASLAETEALVEKAEAPIARLQEVERFRSLMSPGEAAIFVDLSAEGRRPDRLQWIKTILQYGIPSGAASVRIEDERAGGGGGLSISGDFEDRAETDEHASMYRFLLRSADAGALLTAYERMRDRLGRIGVREDGIFASWGAASVRVELEPRPETAPRRSTQAAAALLERTRPPLPIRTAGGKSRLIVLAPDQPEEETDVPQRNALLEKTLSLTDGAVVPAEAFTALDRAVHPSIPRQGGRFVLSVTLRFPYNSEDLNRKLRQTVDDSLAALTLPAGCDLERPPIAKYLVTPGKLRILLLAAMVPVLMLAAASIVLDSAAAGLAALLPGAAGLAGAASYLALSGAPVTAMTLFALAAALCGTLPLAVRVLDVGGRRAVGASAARAVYGTAREMIPGLLSGAALVLSLLGAAAAGADAHRDSWAAPFLVAALAGAIASAASGIVVPAAHLAALRMRRRDPEMDRRRRRPPEWSEPSGLPVLSARSLTKRYRGGFRALTDVSFEIGPGVVGLVGPNGAGKTTLLRLLTGLLLPTRGQVLFRGVPITPESLGTYRHLIGYLPQEFNAYPGFTAEQFLSYWAIERGMDDRAAREREIASLLAVVGLERDAGRKVRDFSGGMRQRIGIARALLGSPPLLIVDEPTTGLDVEARNRFRETLLAVSTDRIVILSTHIASDVEASASRLILLHHGRVRFDGAPADLVARARGRVFETLLVDTDLREFGRRFQVTTRVRILAGIRVRGVAPADTPLPGIDVEPTLEEAYLAEMGPRAARERGGSLDAWAPGGTW